MNEPETIRTILGMRRVAVVGLSPIPARPSHAVTTYLRSVGYDIVPVNPGHTTLLGVPCYPSVADIPGGVEVVNVFRSPEHVPAIVADAIAAGARALWLQDGVVHPEASREAERAGLLVVMDDCILRRHRQMAADFLSTVT